MGIMDGCRTVRALALRTQEVFMKIIISHDVDHLYATDHVFKDLILEKLWVRSFLHLYRGKISLKTFLYRLTILFHNRMHRVDELMQFDRQHHIPSVFFFGMQNGLGMSYSQETALPVIKRVLENGFDAGVHGIDYLCAENIKREHDDFAKHSGMTAFGIRNHYVRFDADTFEKMSQAGYLFDSTWFNKKELELRTPYKVGNMWEFPLCIMDSYVCNTGKTEVDLERTKDAILQAEKKGIPYLTILFHDDQYNEKYDPDMKNWYEKTIEFCENKGFPFISYRDAIKELENA